MAILAGGRSRGDDQRPDEHRSSRDGALSLLIQRTTRCDSCELVHICRTQRLLSFVRWGISGAQQVGAAGTRYFEPDGVAFWGQAIVPDTMDLAEGVFCQLR
jgi:hypothetical protein